MMFEGEKTRVFWWGLIFVGLSVCVLFGIAWDSVVWNTYYVWELMVPVYFGGIVFLLIGLYMMKSGTKEMNQAKPN
jgi:hypothetical protein